MIRLDPHEFVSGREFTHPAFTQYESRILHYMLERLHQVLLIQQTPLYRTLSAVLQQLEPDQRQHRMMLMRPAQLLELPTLFVVGFFGQRRLDADSSPINEQDRLLVEEMSRHPGLLSYSTLELTNGDFANCVLFANEEAKQHWGHSQVHTYSVRELSPTYYFSVRLYNGFLPNGLQHKEALQLTYVKYYDYRDSPAWRAIRPLSLEKASPLASRETASPT